MPKKEFDLLKTIECEVALIDLQINRAKENLDHEKAIFLQGWKKGIEGIAFWLKEPQQRGNENE